MSNNSITSPSGDHLYAEFMKSLQPDRSLQPDWEGDHRESERYYQKDPESEPVIEKLVIGDHNTVTVPADRKWLVDEWLPSGRTTILAGSGGRGKSKLALQLALAVAARDHNTWIDGNKPLTASVSGPVVFATWEDELDEFWRRLLQARGIFEAGKTRTLDDSVNTLNDLLEGNLHIFDLSEHGPIWGPETGIHIGTRASLTRAGVALLDQAWAIKPELLVIDPSAAAFGSNENDRAAVREFMSKLGAFASLSGCAVLLISHPPKSGDSYSGSTDWRNACRSMWNFSTEEVDEVFYPVLTSLKSSYSKTPEPVWFPPDGWRWWSRIDPVEKSADLEEVRPRKSRVAL